MVQYAIRICDQLSLRVVAFALALGLKRLATSNAAHTQVI